MTSPRVKVFFATVADGGRYASKEADEFARWAREQLLHRPGRFVSTDTPDAAEIILFIESAQHKFSDYPRVLLSNTLVRKYADRCFAFNYEDAPIGFLPGVYVSMPRQRIDPARYWAGGYLGTNPHASERGGPNPEWLLSFRGFASWPVRERLFSLNLNGGACAITRTVKWFTHDEADKRTYGEEMRNSKFVLCPRGLGTATGRLFETMAAGRVPVILSDDWAMPVGPPWLDFALQIAEDRVTDVVNVVRATEGEWWERGQLARRIYEDWYAPEAALRRTLQYVEQIQRHRPAAHDERAEQDRWLSKAFAWERGWTTPQRVARALREGKLTAKLRATLGHAGTGR